MAACLLGLNFVLTLASHAETAAVTPPENSPNLSVGQAAAPLAAASQTATTSPADTKYPAGTVQQPGAASQLGSPAPVPVPVPVTPPAAISPAPAQATAEAQQQPASAPAAVPAAPAGHLPGELSPWSMFLAADIVVKVVMVGLAAASFLVWTIWLAKTIELWIGSRKLSRDLEVISHKRSLTEAEAELTTRRSLAFRMLEAARGEASDILAPGAPGRIRSRLSELESKISRDIRSGMSFLATIGSTSPFIGLFGTVWGIMNSFIGISKSQTTNLAVVAPGIAEALLATAIGLVAAIPAVILYNNLGKGIAGYRRLVRETRGEVERIVSRQIDAKPVHRFPGLASAAE